MGAILFLVMKGLREIFFIVSGIQTMKGFPNDESISRFPGPDSMHTHIKIMIYLVFTLFYIVLLYWLI